MKENYEVRSWQMYNIPTARSKAKKIIISCEWDCEVRSWHVQHNHRSMKSKEDVMWKKIMKWVRSLHMYSIHTARSEVKKINIIIYLSVNIKCTTAQQTKHDGSWEWEVRQSRYFTTAVLQPIKPSKHDERFKVHEWRTHNGSTCLFHTLCVVFHDTLIK